MRPNGLEYTHSDGGGAKTDGIQPSHCSLVERRLQQHQKQRRMPKDRFSVAYIGRRVDIHTQLQHQRLQGFSVSLHSGNVGWVQPPLKIIRGTDENSRANKRAVL
jgi:hypothetical protein